MSVPNLPNDFNKFILLIGIALIIYPSIKIESLYLEIDSTQTEFIDSIQSNLSIQRNEENNTYSEYLEYYKQKVDNTIELKRNHINLYLSLLFIGFVSFLVGSLLWINDEKLKRTEIKRDLYRKGLLYDNCQSCGKRFSPIRNFGVNKDNSFNYSFCEECYQDGNFTENIKSSAEFCLKKEKAIRNKDGFFARANLRNRLNNLERWKENEY